MIISDFACDGVEPTGPVCPWPRVGNANVEVRRMEYASYADIEKQTDAVKHDTVIKATAAQMAQGLFKNVKAAVTKGKVSSEIRDIRYNICKKCPHFIEESKRCSECGCFMEAKTWINEQPELLCPKSKWPA